MPATPGPSRERPRARGERCLALGALLLLALASPAATAEEQAGELYSVERRDLLGRHEISFSLGVLPMDAFAKGMTLHGSYAYYFNQLLGWQLIGGLWSFNFDGNLKQVLKDRYDVQPTDVGQLTWVLDSSLVVRPLYGKLALLNSKLLSGELFFVLGYALGGYTAALPSGVNVGAGLRLFISRYFSLRFDIRDYMFFPGFKSMENNLYLSLGLSLTFGFGEEESEE